MDCDDHLYGEVGRLVNWVQVVEMECGDFSRGDDVGGICGGMCVMDGCVEVEWIGWIGGWCVCVSVWV